MITGSSIIVPSPSEINDQRGVGVGGVGGEGRVGADMRDNF